MSVVGEAGQARGGGAMSLRDALQRIYDERGTLTATIVVDEARDESHPLHGKFEWDNSVAAEAYRRAQAQELIRSVKVVYREADDADAARSVRKWHSVRRDTGYAYEPVEKVLENEFTKRLVLADMRREWQALKRRYEQFAEFSNMIRDDLGEEAA